MRRVAIGLAMAGVTSITASAVSPATRHTGTGGRVSATEVDPIATGHELFNRQWSATNPMLGSDGLGPLFNATSCAACHPSGGSADTRFNAKAMGIEKIEVEGMGSRRDLATLIRRFNPGFATPSGQTIATVPVAHFGGSSLMDQIRTNIRGTAAGRTAAQGGDVSPTDVHAAMDNGWVWKSQLDPENGGLQVTIHAKLYQRNSTALFGAGLIDQVSDKTLRRVESIQQRHPEISGRCLGAADRQVWSIRMASQSGVISRVLRHCLWQ